MEQPKGVITTLNINNICLICLEEVDSNLNIDAFVTLEDYNYSPIKPAEMLEKLSKTDPNPHSYDAKRHLCSDCWEQLKQAYILILKYERAQEMIKDFYYSQKLTKDLTESESVAKKPRKCKKTKFNRTKDSTDSPSVSSRLLYPCPICTEEFTSLDLREHVHTHKALKKYLNIPLKDRVSPFAKFVSNNHSTSEKVSIFRQDVITHKCPYCNEEFSAEDLKNHLKVHSNTCDFKCDECGRLFKRINHLNTHKVKHLKEYPFKCSQCGKGFVIKTNYECHILTHVTDELPHECSICSKRFSNPEHLHRHSIIHTENISYAVKYRVCKCNKCLCTFRDKDQLANHNCIQIEQPTTQIHCCNVCKKRFRHASNLYVHTRNVHRMKQPKTLCSVCGATVSNFYVHMRRHSGEKRFECAQCDKKFASGAQLKQHILVHSGLKPYVCSVCSKAFNSSYNLQVHERIHKGDRCHICTICNKGFLEKSYLKKHVTNVHSK